ncbi:peptidase S8/S53 domain-containing protein [Xylaria arbuscula]|nr:peptidase S8/S53 domain-containing protein [Xylaria arbuscula]
MSLRDSLEWDIITAFRGYLICTLPVTNDEFGELDRDGIVRENAKDSFEFELTRVFVRPQPSFDADLDSVGLLQAALSKFMVLLGELANVDGQFPAGATRFEHLFQPLTNEEGTLDSHYHRLWSLLEHLETSRTELNLIKGHLGPAFQSPSDDTLLDDVKTVQELNRILDAFPLSRYKPPLAEIPSPLAAVDHQDARVHDYAATTFRAVFEHLRTCGTPHKLMLDLPSSKNNSHHDLYLDLFISVCPEHCEWQDAGCSMREKPTISPRVVTDINLCREIEWTQSEELSLKIHVNGNEIQNLSQADEYRRHNGDSPSTSLHEMISNGAFRRFNPRDLMLNDHQIRFDRNQKEALAVQIAVALSQLLGSQWVGKGWTAKDMYFLSEKKGGSELPYGPFVSVTANGPESQDWTKWTAKLVKTPHLILFGKLLLEIDLGSDLDEVIDDGLRKTPNKNLSTLLLRLYHEAKSELFYREAIQACLSFHNERKLKRDAKDIDVPEMGWCEWDRKYIQNNIITKLAPTSPQRTKLNQKEPVYYQEHHVRHDLPFTYRAGSKEVPSSLRPSTSKANHQESARHPIPAISFMSPDQSQDKKATIVTRKESRLNEKVELTDGPVSHPTVRTQTVTVKKSAKMSVWLDNIEHAPDVVRGESTPSIFEIGNDEVLLFDDMEYSRPLEQANLAATFWKELGKFNDQLLPRPRHARTTSNIKIALIDTGVDKSDPLVKGELARITGRSWVDHNRDSYHDICGHGTQLVRLVLQSSPTAHILMAKVSNNKTFSLRNVNNIAEAIRWAVQENAHIVSLSLGFKSEIPVIKAALEEAINPESNPGRIVIAAAGNWGYNHPRAFPASQQGVLCVHAVNGIGVDGQFNVKVDANNRIATLGVDIVSEWQGKEVWVSGTSFATPIVAAIAANILEFARQRLDLNPQLWGQLSSYQGMRTALRLMCTDTDKFAYLAPWCLKKSPDEIAEVIKNGLVYGYS